ncbi:UNVERIFIED_CONTAM: P-loop NTPase fold protein [Kocuria sp. CPCC 205316]|uniref:KAP family P-loop NTPase fold protein n=1 Tax=Kocuria TaxID=57493 RepID=UPI0036DD7E3B
MLYNDESITDESQDLIGRSQLVRTITEGIRRLGQNTNSSVAAISGPWGSGKTSLINQIEQVLGEGPTLENQASWKVVRHTPWMFSTYEAEVAALYSELINTLPGQKDRLQSREELADFLDWIAPIGIVARLVDADGMGAISDLSQKVRSGKTPNQLLRELTTHFENSPHNVLVVMDDLDRLDAQELLQVFKMVRLLGRIPKVHYLLSYDEESLLGVLSHTEVTGGDVERGREYLEKIIQLRLDIPPLTAKQRTDLLNNHLGQLYKNHNFILSQRDDDRLSSLWSEHLIKVCEQPRKIMRLVSAVDNQWRNVHAEVDFVDYLAMTYLRLHAFDFYEVVHRNKRLAIGGNFNRFAPRKGEATQQWQQWQEVLSTLDNWTAADVSFAEEISCFLFPTLATSRRNTWYAADDPSMKAPRRVANPLYFDRFYQNNILEEDVSDKAIELALTLLCNGEEPSSNRLLEYFQQKLIFDASITIPRIDKHVANGSPLSLGLLAALADAYNTVMRGAVRDQGQGDNYVWLAMNLLDNTEVFFANLQVRILLQQETRREFALVLCFKSSRGESNWLESIADDVDAAAQKYVGDSAVSGSIFQPALIASLYFHYHHAGKDKSQSDLWSLLERASLKSYAKLLAAVTPSYPPKLGGALYREDLDGARTAIESLLGYRRSYHHYLELVNQHSTCGMGETTNEPAVLEVARAAEMFREIEEVFLAGSEEN